MSNLLNLQLRIHQSSSSFLKSCIHSHLDIPTFVRTYHSCPSSEVMETIEADALQFLSSKFGVFPLGLNREYPAASCEDIVRANPNSKNEAYWIRANATIEKKNCTFI